MPYRIRPPRKASLAPPPIGQLAARDHQHRHDQQEQRDRRLHALHVRVQVVADVVDHHVHVRAREAADELGQRQRGDERARGFDPGRCPRGVPGGCRAHRLPRSACSIPKTSSSSSPNTAPRACPAVPCSGYAMATIGASSLLLFDGPTEVVRPVRCVRSWAHQQSTRPTPTRCVQLASRRTIQALGLAGSDRRTARWTHNELWS